MAVAVGIFGDEEIVANQQRRLHRSRGDVEGLEQEGADHKRDQQSMNDDTDGFTQAAFGFCACSHAHGFPNSLLPAPVAPRAAADRCPHASSRTLRVEDPLHWLLILRARYGAQSAFTQAANILRGRVLDGCWWSRNQRLYQNFISH